MQFPAPGELPVQQYIIYKSGYTVASEIGFRPEHSLKVYGQPHFKATRPLTRLLMASRFYSASTLIRLLYSGLTLPVTVRLNAEMVGERSVPLPRLHRHVLWTILANMY
jgi:hypothetical protein